MYSVSDIDPCSDNETQLISFASQTSPSQGNWNNMINSVLRLGSHGIHIIIRGALAIYIAVLCMWTAALLTLAHLSDCVALS